MPTYEYLCDECGFRFDEFQQITAAPLTTCPQCTGHVHRVISPGNGFIFKGSGFYITDYRNDKYKKEKSKEEKKPAADSASKSADKKESVNNMA